MAVSTLVGTVEQVVQETLYPTILEMRREIDPFIAEYIFPSNNDVTRESAMGRDYKVRKIIELGLAGAVEYDDIMGNNARSDAYPTSGVGDNFTLYGENAPSTWPGLNEMTAAGWVPIGFQLKRFKGNATVPVDLLRVENLPATVGQPAAATVRGLARNVDLALANTFWKETVAATDAGVNSLNYIASFAGFQGASPYGTAQLLDFDGVDTITANGCYDDSASDYVPVQLSYDSSGTPTVGGAAGQIRRLYDGQRVDIYYENTTATPDQFDRLNAVDQPVFVDNVDPLRDSFHLKIKNGSALVLADTRTHYLVPRKSSPSGSATVNTGASGLVDWIKGTGSLGVAVTAGSGLGSAALTLERVPQLRSYLATVSANLSELTLMQYLARCAMALGNLWTVDTLVSTPGVWVGFFDEMDAPISTTSATTEYVSPSYSVNRPYDQPFRIAGGLAKKMTFTYDGRTYVLTSSPFCHAGVCWGLKTRDQNFKMYVPPRIRDTGTHELFSDAVEFIGPLLGYDSIFIPVSSAVAPVGAVTNFRQMPFDLPHEFWPDTIPGMKLSSITESIGARG